MKKITNTLFAILCTGIIVQAQVMPEVFAIRELDKMESINDIAFQNAYKAFAKATQKYWRGWDSYLMKGNRGERAGNYIQVFAISFNAAREYYAPTGEGMSAQAEEAMKQSNFDGNMPYVNDNPDFTDYVVVNYDQYAYPVMGEVVAVRYPELKPGMEEDMLDFMSGDYFETVKKLAPEMNAYLLKGDRGVRKDKYLALWTFDTYESYMKFFTNEGAVTNYGNEKMAELMNLQEKANSFWVEGTMNAFTDYILVK